MSRIVVRGGRIFDGTGADPADGDVAIEDGRIVDVGTGPRRRRGDRRRRADGPARAVRLPVHVMRRATSTRGACAQTPFSYQFYEAGRNLAATLRIGHHDGPRRGRRRPRRQAGASRTADRRAADADLDHHAQPDRRPRRRLVPVRCGRSRSTSSTRAGRPGSSTAPTRCAGRSASSSATAPTSSRSRRAAASCRRATTRATPTSARGARGARRGGDRRRHLRHGPRPGRRRHQERRPGRHPSIDHGIYLDDEGIELMKAARDVVRADARRAAGRARRGRGRRPAPPAVVDKARMVVEIHRAAFRHAVEAGVRIAMGTDSGVTPHGQNLRELQLMVDGGMTPAAALEATTRSAAAAARRRRRPRHDRGRASWPTSWSCPATRTTSATLGEPRRAGLEGRRPRSGLSGRSVTAGRHVPPVVDRVVDDLRPVEP